MTFALVGVLLRTLDENLVAVKNLVAAKSLEGQYAKSHSPWKVRSSLGSRSGAQVQLPGSSDAAWRITFTLEVQVQPGSSDPV